MHEGHGRAQFKLMMHAQDQLHPHGWQVRRPAGLHEGHGCAQFKLMMHAQRVGNGNGESQSLPVQVQGVLNTLVSYQQRGLQELWPGMGNL